MNVRPILIALSLAGNVALLGAVLFWSPTHRDTVAPSAAPLSIAKSRDAAVVTDQNPVAANSSPKPAWEQLRDDDLSALVSRLRAAGFPPAMVRAAVSALVNDRLAPRRRAIEAASEKPFWKGRDEIDPAAQTALSALDQERRKLIKQALGSGVDGNDEDIRAAIRQEIGRDLPPEKIEQIFKVKTEQGDRLYAEYAKMNGSVRLPEDWARIQQLQGDLHDALARVLTPEELIEYDLRNSNTAGMLRNQLGPLRPTEAEFRALFPLFQKLDEKYPLKMGGTNTEEDMAPRNAALAEMKEQIKTLLGPERFAEYELSRDYNYQQTAKVTERLNLPTTATREVYAVQKEIEQRALQFRGNRALSAEDRTAQLAALASEASAKISAVLGADGLEAYRQHGGQWLQQLTPRPRANAKAP